MNIYILSMAAESELEGLDGVPDSTSFMFFL